MIRFFNINFNYTKKTLVIGAILLFLLFYPYPLVIFGTPLITHYLKQRLLTLGILFLVVRGLIPESLAPQFVTLFLIALILSSTFTFGQILFALVAILIVLKLFKQW